MITPNRRRRWYQFRLRTLLVLMLLACIGLGWFAMKMRQARRQREAIVAIQAGGGQVTDWSKDFAPTFQGWNKSQGGVFAPSATPVPLDYEEESRAHAWLRWLLGDDFFTHPTRALVTNNVGMEHLDGLPQLEVLCLRGDQIIDADLANLKHLPHLSHLFIYGYKITDAGLEHVTGLTQLNAVYVSCTRISESGVRNLRKSLPSIRISIQK